MDNNFNEKHKNYVYILECRDGTLYTGWTKDLESRVDTHNKGEGAKYTKQRVPVKIKYFEIFDSKIDAQKREYEIKRLTRKQKLKLIDNFNFNVR